MERSWTGKLMVGAACAGALALAGAASAAAPEIDLGGDESVTPLPPLQQPPPPPKKKKPEPKKAPPPAPPAPEKRPVGPKRPFGEELQVLDRIRFEALVRDDPGRTQPVVLRDLRWTCQLTRCTAEGPRLRFGVEACAELARAVGPITSFRAAGRSLTKAELLRCNEAVASAGGFGVAPGGGGFGPPRAGRPQPPPAAPKPGAELAGLAEAFRKAVAALPPSPYSDRCPDPFSGGLLGHYLKAAGKGDVEAARMQLVRIDRRLHCVSAQRFAGLHGALGDALRDRALPPDAAAALIPAVLLFVEYGGGDFRAEFLEWLRANRGVLVAALSNPGSALASTGLLARLDGSPLLLDGEEAGRLLTALDGTGLDSGLCTLLELDLLESDDGGRKKLFCPKDCREPLFSRDDEAGGRLAGTLPEDVKQQCEQLKETKEKLRKERPGLAACIREFNEASSDLLACQAEGLSAHRAARLEIDDPREYTREDIYLARRCHRGQDPGLSAAWYEASNNLTDAENYNDKMQSHVEELEHRVRQFDPNFAPEPGETVVAVCHSCSVEEMDEFEQLVEDLQEAKQLANKAALALLNAQDEEERAWQALQDSTRCAPHEECADDCGIQDALAAHVQGCIQQASARKPPEKKGGEGGGAGPDPTRATPDPRGPGYVPGSVSGLQECLRKAGASSGRQGDPACDATTCPDDKVPTPDPKRPGKCTCQEPKQRSAEGYCRGAGYIDCGEEACECQPLEVKVRGAIGEGEGAGPGGRGGGDPSPYRIPLD